MYNFNYTLYCCKIYVRFNLSTLSEYLHIRKENSSLQKDTVNLLKSLVIIL